METETVALKVLISRSRQRLKWTESQCQDWDRDWKSLSLNFETEAETEIFLVSMLRPSLRLDKLSWAELKTEELYLVGTLFNLTGT